MGYYDDDGNYHSFRRGLQRAADKIAHPFEHRHHNKQQHSAAGSVVPSTTVREERDSYVIKEREYVSNIPTAAPAPGVSSGTSITTTKVVSCKNKMGANAIPIPCHHIRIGDLLVLQARPCQVIRITTSAQTGQHRYLGVDLFTKQLHEESSFISNPSPSVVVQNMYGPVFKQYRVLDIREDGRIVAMTETGEIKQGLSVLDQNNLFNRISESFDNGRGSIRVLVINDNGQELAVDYKVVHGSRL